MHTTIESDRINKFLTRFGRNLAEEPIFRLVWSDDMRELRRGTFNEYYGSIFLRTTTGVKEVPKYTYLAERWIIEMWLPPAISFNPEVPESVSGSYEPLYVFEDRMRNALPLNQRVVEIVVNAKLKPQRSSALIRSDVQAEHDAKDSAETRYFEEAIDTSPVQSLLRTREAIVVPSNYRG